LEVETQGNFNTLGWFLTAGDDDWWVSGNLGNEPNDLFSIAHHEMGHAFIFNPAQPNFAIFKALGFVQDAAVLAYHGSYPHIDSSDHLNGERDNASLRGAFGYEYYGSVPQRRWLITKLDILVAQAIGYRIRQTSAFVPLALAGRPLSQGTRWRPYVSGLQATGGIPFYNWTVAAGALPDGLTLNAFTGTISGAPTKAGTFNFTIRVQEYVEGGSGVTASFSIDIAPPKSLGPGDFDGDGKTDITVYRPSNGGWYELLSGTNYSTYGSYLWGLPGDVPVRGDFDGDGKADVAVYRRSNGTWYILLSSTGYTTYVSYAWGLTGDLPVLGDFDGDGKSDVAVYRPSNGGWYILQSSTNYTTYAGYLWGIAGDIPVLGDFDGDGRTDIAVYRPSNGDWYILWSSTSYMTYSAYQWGLAADIPLLKRP
jgi:hypothetical protein